MEKDHYFVGTELKFALTIECEGFSMDEDPWTATVKRGSRKVVCQRGENSVKDDDQWYILVDSSLLGKGECELVIDIDVPDPDFEDGYRHEVWRQEFFMVLR